MSNIAHRGARQSENVVIRLTPQDKTQLRLKAQADATNISAIIRQALIRQGLITPVVSSDGQPW